jgi:hypothetical protein
VGPRGNARIVSDDHQRNAVLAAQILQKIEHIAARLRIQIPRWLVGSRNPSAIQQSLTLDQRFGSQGVLSVSYVGTEGHHLLALSTPQGGLSRNAENTCPGILQDTGPITTTATQFPVPGCYNGFKEQPVGGPGSTLILGTQLIGSGANSSYNSLQASVTEHIGPRRKLSVQLRRLCRPRPSAKLA